MYDIEIANSQAQVELNETWLRAIAERTLEEEQVVAAEISVAVVDNATIRELNRRYLEHDFDTDVLSFLLDADQPEMPPPAGSPRGAGKRIDGEIVVSAEMAFQRAPEFGWSPGDELVLYLVHGLLHLTGYDDLTEPERKLMRAREREILALWNLTPGSRDEAPGDMVS